MSLRRRAFAALEAVEKRPYVVAAVLAALYLLRVSHLAFRPFWYDELLTYHIANSATWNHFVFGILHVDLNPPLQHILTFLTLKMFGDSPVAARLPSILSFVVASFLLYRIALPRLGTWYAATVVLLFWTSRWFDVATEARPYALLIACFAGTFLAWRRAAERTGGTASLWLLFAWTNAMLWSHCYAVFLLIPFAVAELYRWLSRRKADWAIATAFVTACALALPLYLHLLRNSNTILVPPQFVTNWLNLALIYASIVLPPSVLALLVASLLIGVRPSVHNRAIPDPLPAIERVFLGALLLVPLCQQMVFIHAQGSFYRRYAIGYGFFASLLVVAALRRWTRRDLVCAAVASVGLFVMVGYDAVYPEPSGANQPLYRKAAYSWYRGVRPDLLFVCAGGITFVEMNESEPDSFLSRLYYLNDRQEQHRAHTTVYEGLPIMIRYMGGRAHLDTYSAFTAAHRHFLVLTTVDYPEDWLVPKLVADGAVLKQLEKRETGYLDQTLFDVTLPEAAAVSGAPTNRQGPRP